MAKNAPFSGILALPAVLIKWSKNVMTSARIQQHLRRVCEDRTNASPALLLAHSFPAETITCRTPSATSSIGFSPSQFRRRSSVQSWKVDDMGGAVVSLGPSPLFTRVISYSAPLRKDLESGTLAEAPPDHSVLNPPKPPPTIWQIFFTDWLENKRTFGPKGVKLNVATEAKNAARAYNELDDDTQNNLKARAKVFKEEYGREYEAWQRSITPADVERENAFRKAQRKSGKSKKKNLVDPNAPKKPLSAYFLFLQDIRSNPVMTQEIFGDVTEPPKQSVLAAAKWRSMNAEEKEPYLSSAAKAKQEYEAAMQAYQLRTQALQEGTTGFMAYISPAGVVPSVIRNK